MRRLRERYGTAFTVNVPVIGETVIISDPARSSSCSRPVPRLSRGEIADQLLTLLAAGHETTATTLAWAVERLRRHPAVLRRLADEADAGGSDLREATILEVQRVRPVIDKTARQIRAPGMWLGRWTLPPGQVVLVSIYLIHNDEAVVPARKPLRPGPLRGQQAGYLSVDPVRRWRPAMHRRRLRPHGDERGTARTAARLHPGADE